MKNYSLKKIINASIKRKWLVFSPLIITLCLTYAYTKEVKYYQSKAIISFNANYLLDASDSVFENKAKSLVFSLLYGDNLRTITKKAFPTIDENVDINRKMQALGSGISLGFRKDNYRALTIRYTSSEPQESYNVVKATIDTIIEKNEALREVKLTKSTLFLEDELNRYSETLSKIEKELFELGGNPSQSIEKDPIITQIESSLINKQQELQALRGQGYGDSHPKRKQLASEIAGLQRVISKRKKSAQSN